MIAAFPGSFNPPTRAHLAVARAALEATGGVRVDLVLSRLALGKEAVVGPSVDDRAAVLREVASTRPWLGVVVTDLRLVRDIAAGYDAVVLGADKWEQVVDSAWYGNSPTARDEAVARLPHILVAPRDGHDTASVADRFGIAADVTMLDVPPEFAGVSSTLVRSGHRDLMLPEASASGLWG